MATPTPTKPRIRWSVYSGPNDEGRLVRIPKTSKMRGHWPGYDATCSCGWDSSTGGAVLSYVKNAVWEHKTFDCPLRADA